jgi:taurine transport system ATP-binding protein
MLQVQQASVFFEQGKGQVVQALDRVSFDIPTGGIVVALGTSGCGKSTLLNAIAGFMPLSEGAILLDGEPVERPGADRGVVFQKDALLPWRSVADNVALGLDFAGLPRRERRARAEELLRLVHLDGFGDAQPHELSGGMRQRVGLARALATDPRLLLMDEPFGALDSLTREHMQDLLVEVWAKTGKQVFFITHSIEEALMLGTTVLVMSPRPGRVVARWSLDFVRRLAAGETADALRRTPRFQELHEEIRSLIHAGQQGGRLQ